MDGVLPQLRGRGDVAGAALPAAEVRGGATGTGGGAGRGARACRVPGWDVPLAQARRATWLLAGRYSFWVSWGPSRLRAWGQGLREKAGSIPKAPLMRGKAHRSIWRDSGHWTDPGSHLAFATS